MHKRKRMRYLPSWAQYLLQYQAMCQRQYVSQMLGLYEKFYNEAYADGFSAGYTEGQTDGYNKRSEELNKQN